MPRSRSTTGGLRQSSSSSSILLPRSSTSRPSENQDVNEGEDDIISHAADDLEGRPTGFRFNGVRFLLTYSGCENLTLAELEDALQQWEHLTAWKIGREHPPHGGLRYFLLVVFSVRLRGRDRRIFDVGGIHPNIKAIQPGQNAFKRVYDHITKGGDTHGPLAVQEGRRDQDKGAFWGQAIGAASSEEARELIIDGSPRDYVRNFNNIKTFLHDHFSNDLRTAPLEMRSRYEFSDENLPPALIEWRNTQFLNKDRPKTLILVGPTRLGKSQWARSLDAGVAYMETDFDPSIMNADTTYLVISDIPDHKIGGMWVFRKLKGFFGAQDTITITAKYLPIMSFKWGKPFIYLCNELPNMWRQDSWLTQNTVIIDLDQRLY